MKHETVCLHLILWTFYLHPLILFYGLLRIIFQSPRSQQHEKRKKSWINRGFHTANLNTHLMKAHQSFISVDFWSHVVSMLGRSEVIIHLNWPLISISMNSHLHHLYHTALLCGDSLLKVFLIKLCSTKVLFTFAPSSLCLWGIFFTSQTCLPRVRSSAV